jgi:hypothetical protein
MGYATVMNVPRVTTYPEAKKIHDSTTPIRGRSPEIRPLGNRRDADSYWVRMNGDDVEFVLYKSPVITYKPDGSVVLTPDTYSTVSTHQFFARVLGVGANAVRQNTVITLHDNKRYTVRGKDTLTLKLDASGNWQCVEGAKAQFAWHLDRREATNVRNRYKEFITYFKGMVSLRTEEIEMPYYSNTYQGIRVSLTEIQQAFETELTEPDNILGTVQYIQDLPQRHYNYGTQREAEYRDGIAWFTEIIKSDQPEDAKHLNFYRGALAVLLTAERIYQRGQDDNTYIAKAKNITKALDTTLLRAHAEQVLIRKELPIGSVSKGAYDMWLPERT